MESNNSAHVVDTPRSDQLNEVEKVSTYKKSIQNENIVDALVRIQPNDKVVYAQFAVGQSPVINRFIERMVNRLEKEKVLMRFNKRSADGQSVALIAVGVTPAICKLIEGEIKRLESIKPAPVDVEEELMKIYG
ncbi:MAG: hypothetical protein V4606_03310 [Patescibacteria group bacterium]